MPLPKPENEFSEVILAHAWPDITGEQFAEVAEDFRADQKTAIDTADDLRLAYYKVQAEENGLFAQSSARAYCLQESMWRDLADFRGTAAADVDTIRRIGDLLRNTLIAIDEEAHEKIRALEPMETVGAFAYGTARQAIIVEAFNEANAATDAAAAEVDAIGAKAPTSIFTPFTPPPQPSQGHRGHVTPVDSMTNHAGGNDARDFAEVDGSKGPLEAKALGNEQQNDSRDFSPDSSKPGHGTDGPDNASSDTRAFWNQPSKSDAAAQGTAPSGVMRGGLSPLTTSGGGTSSGGGSGGGSAVSGLSGLGRGGSGVGNVGAGSSPRMPSAPVGAGGPVQDFAKGFTTAAGSTTGAPVARPVLPAEGVSPPPALPGASGSAPGRGVGPAPAPPAAPVVGPSAAAVPVGGVGPVGPGGGAGGPLPPFGSDLRSSAGVASGSAGASAATTPAGGTGAQGGGSGGGPAAVLSGAGGSGAVAGRAISQAGYVDLLPAQRAVWEFQHACRRDGWYIDWAVGLFEYPEGIRPLFVSNDGFGCVPATVSLPREMLAAMTDPVLPADFVSRWFGWADVTRLMVEYGEARVAGGKTALLGLATSGSTTAAERAGVLVRSASIDTNPIPHDDPVPGLTVDRCHRLVTLDAPVYHELMKTRDTREVVAEWAGRCQKLVSDPVSLPTCGHDVIGKLAAGQSISEQLLVDLRKAYKDAVLLASTQRPGRDDYREPEIHQPMQMMYGATWTTSQVLEALLHISAEPPNLVDAAYALIAAERIRR